MILTFNSAGQRFEACDCYEIKERLKADLFQWDKTNKCWYTTDSRMAAKYIQIADAAARQAITVLEERRQNAIAASSASVSTIQVPCPEGLKFYPFQLAGIEYITGRQNTLLADDMGCIDGAATIHVNRGGKGSNVTLADAYGRFNGLDQENYNWDATIPTYVKSLCGSDLRLHRVRAILDKGIKPVSKLVLSSGKQLRLTPDHEVKLKDGSWKHVSELHPGSVILTNGKAACSVCNSDERVITYRYAKFRGICKKCMYRNKRAKPTWKGGRSVDRDGYVRVSGQQDHSRANLAGQVYEHILVMEKLLGRPIIADEVVHHENGDKTDNQPKNLRLLTKSEHGRHHGSLHCFRNLNGGRAGTGGTVRFVPVPDIVVSVVPDGDCHVYDVVCDDPHRNFVANGIVVHNCGKSIQTIGFINLTPTISSVLIVCPASVKINWSRELARWLTRPFTIGIANGGKFPATQIVIINYDILKKHVKALTLNTWDLMVLDECQAIRNSKTQRSESVRQIPATRKLLLTGTPIVNRPKELFNLINLLDPARWPNFFKYGIRFCAGYQSQWGWDFTGASHLDELQQILRETVMLRRRKVEVIKELPPKTRQVIELPSTGMEDFVRQEQEVSDRYETMMLHATTEMEFAQATGNREDYEAAVAGLRKAHAYGFEEMANVRHLTAVAKLPVALEELTDRLESIDKILVFAHHHDVIAGLMAGLAAFNPVSLTGEHSQTQRQEAIDRFQTDPTCRVFIGSIQASGLGITLTAASTVAFVELDWVPGNITQAEDRAHRIGQAGNVLVLHLVVDGSIDSKLAKTILEKQRVIDAALDRTTQDKPYDLLSVVKRETAKADQKAQIAQAASELTATQVEAIKHILSYLSSRCDGAEALDGQGFNRFDSRFGKSLAQFPHLTQNQAVFAFKLCRKYRRQIPESLYEVVYGEKEK